MQEHQPEPVFDSLIPFIRAADLSTVRMIERRTVTTHTQQNAWKPLSKEVTVNCYVGSTEALLMEEIVASASMQEQVQINLESKLIVGDTFFRLPQLNRLGYDEPVTLQHRTGETLLAVFGNNRPSTEQVLNQIQNFLHNHPFLEQKVRVVTVFILADAEDSAQLRDVAELNKWTAYELFWAIRDNEDNPQLSKMLAQVNRWSVILVGQTGVVEVIISQMQEISSEHLLNQLNNLFTSVPLSQNRTPEPKNTIPYLGENSWKKFQKLFENLPDTPLRAHSDLRLEAESCRIYENGVIIYNVTPLKIVVFTQASHQQTDISALKEIIGCLDADEYIITPIDKESSQLQFRFTCETVQTLMSRYQLKGEATIVSKYELDVISGSEWKITQHYIEPNVAYTGHDVISKGESLVASLKEYSRRTMAYDDGVPKMFQLPFRTTGTRFVGIDGVKDYYSRCPIKIIHEEGTTQIILILNNKRIERNSKCVKDFVAAVDGSAHSVRLHIIYTNKDRPMLLNDLYRRANTKIRVYSADASSNDIRFAEISRKCALVVNPSGMLVGLDYMRSVDQITKMIQDPDAHDRGISRQFANRLQGVPLSSEFKAVQRSLQSLPEEALIKLSYFVSSPVNDPTQAIVIQPTLHTSIKEADKPLLDPLFKFFDGQQQLLESTAPWVKLPEGESCVDCNTELRFPYYYFFVSQVHRCVQCTQLQEPFSLQLLLKYPVLQNSVLMFESREIRATTLGFNLQPQEEHQCQPHDYLCKGCEGDIVSNEPRYFCIECAPEHRLSFCDNCIKVLYGSNQQARSTLQRISTEWKDTHKLNHCLLRILYKIAGKSEY